MLVRVDREVEKFNAKEVDWKTSLKRRLSINTASGFHKDSRLSADVMKYGETSFYTQENQEQTRKSSKKTLTVQRSTTALLTIATENNFLI